MAGVEPKPQKNPISRLQEICQIWKYPIPAYRESDGTYQLFGTEVTVTIGNELTIAFSAYGKNKKESKANAAEKALAHLQENYPHLMEPPPLPELDPSAFSQPIIKKITSGHNKQKEDTFNMTELARETEELKHVQVGLDMGRLIQQNRMKAKLNQKELAARINEKPQVISDYEQGKAIPNTAILKKIERALGVYLTGERAGEPIAKRH